MDNFKITIHSQMPIIPHGQTWNLSQAPQACLYKILLVWVKSLGKHTLFLSQFSLVCVQVLGVELSMVNLHYK